MPSTPSRDDPRFDFTNTPKLHRLFSRNFGNNGNGNGDEPPEEEDPSIIEVIPEGAEQEDDEGEVASAPVQRPAVAVPMNQGPPEQKVWGPTRSDLDIGNTPGYDDQLISFLSSLTVDGTVKAQTDYLNLSQLTNRAKLKLKLAAIVLLDSEFATTRIRNEKDWQRLQDEFQLVLIQIPIGLTKYDISPEFLHAVQLLTIKFQAKLNKAKGGWFLDKIKSQRTETVEETRGSPSYQDTEEKKGIKDRIMMSLR